jgi:hypothetical protein
MNLSAPSMSDQCMIPDIGSNIKEYISRSEITEFQVFNYKINFWKKKRILTTIHSRVVPHADTEDILSYKIFF